MAFILARNRFRQHIHVRSDLHLRDVFGDISAEAYRILLPPGAIIVQLLLLLDRLIAFVDGSLIAGKRHRLISGGRRRWLITIDRLLTSLVAVSGLVFCLLRWLVALRGLFFRLIRRLLTLSRLFLRLLR